MSANISARAAPALREADPARLFRVGGITAFSATDYPGKLAAVVFASGCPWRCNYCHNTHLQVRATDSAIPWSSVLDLLERRVGLIDAVVFSGGEATADPALWKAILDARALGFDIGLHTAGAYPGRLMEVLQMVDWVGFDVKAPFDSYQRITGIANSGSKARTSAEALLASGISHEFRTTIHPALLSEDDILGLAQTLAAMGVKNYALQVFRAQGCQDEQLNAMRIDNYPSTDLVHRVSDLFQRFTLRCN